DRSDGEPAGTLTPVSAGIAQRPDGESPWSIHCALERFLCALESIHCALERFHCAADFAPGDESCAMKTPGQYMPRVKIAVVKLGNEISWRLLRPQPSIQTPVADRFAEMWRFDLGRFVQVGDRARHFQNAIMGSGR